jgi:hypothetical protein
MGQLLAGHGLLIAAMQMGSPIVDDVTQLLYANAGLAAAVRDGSVETVEVSGGSHRAH